MYYSHMNMMLPMYVCFFWDIGLHIDGLVGNCLYSPKPSRDSQNRSHGIHEIRLIDGFSLLMLNGHSKRTFTLHDLANRNRTLTTCSSKLIDTMLPNGMFGSPRIVWTYFSRTKTCLPRYHNTMNASDRFEFNHISELSERTVHTKWDHRMDEMKRSFLSLFQTNSMFRDLTERYVNYLI